MPPGRFTPPPRSMMNRGQQNFPQMGMGPSQFRRQPGMMRGPSQRGFQPFGGGFQGNRAMGNAANRGQGGSGGGLLSRLFQRSGGAAAAGNRTAGAGAANALTGFQRAGAGQGGGILSSLTNPGTIQSFLGNTQSLLKTAGQFGPMVQQYGPLMRNLPAMWRLYRGLKNADFSEDQSDEKPTSESTGVEETPDTDKETNQKPAEGKRKKTKSSPKPESDDIEAVQPSKGSSKPKLYI